MSNAAKWKYSRIALEGLGPIDNRVNAATLVLANCLASVFVPLDHGPMVESTLGHTHRKSAGTRE
jgi:hypothetical protein